MLVLFKLRPPLESGLIQKQKLPYFKCAPQTKIIKDIKKEIIKPNRYYRKQLSRAIYSYLWKDRLHFSLIICNWDIQ